MKKLIIVLSLVFIPSLCQANFQNFNFHFNWSGGAVTIPAATGFLLLSDGTYFLLSDGTHLILR